MNLKQIINKIPDVYWYFAAVILIFPALFINLGMLPLNEDESIRALVALEMKYSGNLITPTLNGVYYYFKPPLYNWIILIFYNLLNDTGTWTARFVTIVNLLGFTLTIFLINKKYLNIKTAALIALIYITCGRIIYWDSMLAYIDISYSWVTYVEIMSIYIFYKRKKFWFLFLVSYFLMSIGFLMKGYTSLPFQGLSLLVFFIWKKEFRKLFSIQHFVGIILFFSIVGGYYYTYNQYNDIVNTINPLLDQSVRRTALHQSIDIWQTILHLFTYPFENLYHFLPWSVMGIYLLSKNNIKKIFENDYVAFNFLMFCANIVVYWISVEVYPRYILMLMPLLFTVFVYLYEIDYSGKKYFYRILIAFLGILFFLTFVFSFVPYFDKYSKIIDGYIVKTIFLNLSILILGIIFFLKKNNKLIILVMLVLVVRIGYDWFVLTSRRYRHVEYDKEAMHIGDKYKNKNLYFYKKSRADYTASYYIAKQRGKITTREYKVFKPGNYYIYDTTGYAIDTSVYKIEDEFGIRVYERRIFVVQPKKLINEQ